MKVLLILAFAVLVLSGCAKATIEHTYQDGSTSLITVPFLYQYDEQSKVLRSDEHLVNASSAALMKIAEKSPEIISEVGKKIIEEQKEKDQQQP